MSLIVTGKIILLGKSTDSVEVDLNGKLMSPLYLGLKLFSTIPLALLFLLTFGFNSLCVCFVAIEKILQSLLKRKRPHHPHPTSTKLGMLRKNILLLLLTAKFMPNRNFEEII
jgi:hypothetical protein